MPIRAETTSAAEPSSGGERLDVEPRGRAGERRILRRKRQTQAHGELEVGRIISGEAPLPREWQHIAERTPWHVRIDANIELADDIQEFSGSRPGDAPVFLRAKQNVPDLQGPKHRDMSRRSAQSIEKRPRRRRAFVIEAPGDRHRGIEDETAHRLPSSRSFFHDSRASLWPWANALARAIGSPAPVRRGEFAGMRRATATPRR